MLSTQAIALVNEALWLVLVLSAPPILAATVVGLLVAVIQSATQIQESTLQYAVKFFVVVLAIFMTTGFMASTLYRFGDAVFSGFPALIRA